MSFKLTATATSAPLPRSHNGLIFLLCHSYTTVTLRLALGAFLAVIVGLAPTISGFPCFPFSLVMFGATWGAAPVKLRTGCGAVLLTIG